MLRLKVLRQFKCIFQKKKKESTTATHVPQLVYIAYHWLSNITFHYPRLSNLKLHKTLSENTNTYFIVKSSCQYILLEAT